MLHNNIFFYYENIPLMKFGTTVGKLWQFNLFPTYQNFIPTNHKTILEIQ